MTNDKKFTLNWARRKLRLKAPLSLPGIELTFCTIHGRRVAFAIDMRRDPIQREHRAGRFYEQEELDVLRKYVAAGSTFVDIGANVGNHSIYAALFFAAEKVIPFEPNPSVCKLLIANVLLNNLSDIITFQQLGLGLSDQEAANFGMQEQPFNLGASKMLEGEGDIEISTGDLRLEGETPHFIKIDVEGMEMGVLRGLEKTIERCKPNLLIEVDEKNYRAFDQWVEKMGYEIAETFKHYRNNKNFILCPKAPK